MVCVNTLKLCRSNICEGLSVKIERGCNICKRVILYFVVVTQFEAIPVIACVVQYMQIPSVIYNSSFSGK
jgi:hypothetical protein